MLDKRRQNITKKVKNKVIKACFYIDTFEPSKFTKKIYKIIIKNSGNQRKILKLIYEIH